MDKEVKQGLIGSAAAGAATAFFYFMVAHPAPWLLSFIPTGSVLLFVIRRQFGVLEDWGPAEWEY
ncbi:MAG: hypothetical protein PHU95_07620 [Candidatus Thermoplasmatota archaeon]|nr:hypothetical protein [Candidatus Thermoplasmatota archaeon]